MMITLKLIPQVPIGEVAPLTVVRQGEKLNINGEVLDLAFMEQGDSLPSGSIDHPLLSDALIEKGDNGILIEGLLFYIASDQTDPAACFPEPVVITQDGPVFLPSQLAPPSPPLVQEPEDEYQD